jgi:uncharacterized protein involved in outer membrane biogenesis
MKKLLIGLAVVLIGLPVLAIGGAYFLLDADQLRPRLVAAVQNATGRAFTAGNLRVALSLRPAVTLTDIALANAPANVQGGSQPQMLTAKSAEVQLALLPLLSRRVEISRVVLDSPDLLLETNAQGVGNWVFTSTSSAPAQPTTTSGAPAAPLSFSIDTMRVDNGRVRWRGAAGLETVEIATLEAGLPLAGDTRVTAQIKVRGQGATLEATTGPLAALRGDTPWPIRATLAGLGATLRAEGALTAGALRLAVQGEAPNLNGFAPLLPGVALPPLTDIKASATVTAGAAALQAEAIVVTLGASEPVPGLRLASARLAAGNLDGPLTVDARVRRGALPVHVTGQTASLRGLAAGGAVPFDLAAAAAGTRMTARGTYTPGTRPNVAVALASPALDLDALRAAMAGQPAPAAPASTGAVPVAPASDGRMIPAITVDLAGLRSLDAAATLAVARLVSGGVAYTDLAAELRLADGQARIAPFRVTTPAGPLALEVTAIASDAAPRLRVVARSPGLDLGALARLAGAQPMVTGRAQLDADLGGQGADTRAMAAGASGHLRLALVDGAITRAALRQVPAQALELLAPGGLPAGDVALRCFALRAPVQAGLANIGTLYAESALGRAGGGGGINLREETLALRLMVDARAGRVAVRAPVNIAGPWAAPRFAVDPAAAAAAGLGALLSQQGTPDRTLQGLADALGGRAGGAAPALGDCGTALAAARGGAAGPMPTTAAAPEPQAAPATGEAGGGSQGIPQPADLLRGLFGR